MPSRPRQKSITDVESASTALLEGLPQGNINKPLKIC